jgi:threonine/homoserine/homoserine lactone efflux protein
MTDLLPPSLLAFALTCAIIEITPGPNMGYLAALALARGWITGMAAVAGVAVGLTIYGLAAALGLAALIERSTIFYEVLRWAGIAYLGWLAWEAWFAQDDIAPDAANNRDDELRSAFRRGLVTNLLNPKAAIFYIAVVPTFVTAKGNDVLAQTLLLSGIFVVIATGIHSAIVLLASQVHDYLTDPTWRRPIRRVMALALAAITIWFAFSTMR